MPVLLFLDVVNTWSLDMICKKSNNIRHVKKSVDKIMKE